MRTANAGVPLTTGMKPLTTVDAWERALIALQHRRFSEAVVSRGNRAVGESSAPLGVASWLIRCIAIENTQTRHARVLPAPTDEGKHAQQAEGRQNERRRLRGRRNEDLVDFDRLPVEAPGEGDPLAIGGNHEGVGRRTREEIVGSVSIIEVPKSGSPSITFVRQMEFADTE